MRGSHRDARTRADERRALDVAIFSRIYCSRRVAAFFPNEQQGKLLHEIDSQMYGLALMHSSDTCPSLHEIFNTLNESLFRVLTPNVRDDVWTTTTFFSSIINDFYATIVVYQNRASPSSIHAHRDARLIRLDDMLLVLALVHRRRLATRTRRAQLEWHYRARIFARTRKQVAHCISLHVNSRR